MRISPCGNDTLYDSALVLLTEEDCANLPAFDDDMRGVIATLISRKDFTGKKDSLLRVPVLDGTLYLLGLGKTAKCTMTLLRDSLAKGLRTAGKNRTKSAFVPLAHLEREGLYSTLCCDLLSN